jgi:hypothetical protein
MYNNNAKSLSSILLYSFYTPKDGNKREEAETIFPKVKSWRDAGDMPGRKKDQEETKC